METAETVELTAPEGWWLQRIGTGSGDEVLIMHRRVQIGADLELWTHAYVHGPTYYPLSRCTILRQRTAGEPFQLGSNYEESCSETGRASLDAAVAEFDALLSVLSAIGEMRELTGEDPGVCPISATPAD